MTQKELLALPHLAVAEVNEKWVHIHTEEGYYVTDYKESDDIITYNGFLCMYAPVREEYTEYRVITENEHLEYEKNKQEKINEEYRVITENEHLEYEKNKQEKINEEYDVQ